MAQDSQSPHYCYVLLRVVDEPVRVQVLVGVEVGVALLAVVELLAGVGGFEEDLRVELAHVLGQFRHPLPADLALLQLGGGLRFGWRFCNGALRIIFVPE